MSDVHTTTANAVPERLGRYRLVRPISTGGMARVFEARRESLAGVSPRVAIKVILPDFAADNAFQNLFVNEARIGSQLQHQNLVQIQDFDRDGDRFYLVMEYVDGLTLRRVVGICRQHGLIIPMAIIAEMGRQSAEGLHYLHTASAEDGTSLHLVHRDIKPSNLMLNGQGVLKLLDFGISRAFFSREKAGTVKGTWGYMAPEQARGVNVGPQSDQFGLACVIYELATLQPLFPEKGAEDIRNLLDSDEAARRAAALTGPYASLAPVLIRALQRDPDARYPSTLAFGRALMGLAPDIITARELLVQFQHSMIEIQEDPSVGANYRSWSTLQPASGVSSSASPSSNASLGTGGSNASSPHQDSQPYYGLPIAVGAAPPGLILPPEPAPETSSSNVPTWAWITLLLSILILGAGVLYVLGRPEEPQRHAPMSNVGAVNPNTLESIFGGSPSGSESPRETPAPKKTSENPVRTETPKPKLEEPPKETSPTPAPDKAPPPEPTPARSSETTAERPAESVAASKGMLTVSSLPRAQVIVDGQFVRWVPMFQQPVSAGSHTVTLITEDDRRYTFRVIVPAGQEVRRIWHFDRGAWAEQ